MTHAYRPFDDPAPDNAASMVLTAEQLAEADQQLLHADKVLRQGYEVQTCDHKYGCMFSPFACSCIVCKQRSQGYLSNILAQHRWSAGV